MCSASVASGDQVGLQASDAPEEEPVPVAPARSPFQKPSVQVMSLSDEAFEGHSAQVIAMSSTPLCCQMSAVPCCLTCMAHRSV